MKRHAILMQRHDLVIKTRDLIFININKLQNIDIRSSEADSRMPSMISDGTEKLIGVANLFLYNVRSNAVFTVHGAGARRKYFARFC